MFARIAAGLKPLLVIVLAFLVAASPALAAPSASIDVSPDRLAIGDTAVVTIRFSEPVTGFDISDMSVATGTLSALATSDNITWVSTYTPSASVTQANNSISLDGSNVSYSSGDPGVGTITSNNFAIDTRRPTATIALDNTALVAGSTSSVTITFSEPVTGLTRSDVSAPNGNLSEFLTEDGGVSWTATFTPDPVFDTTNVMTLANSGVVDLAGNTGSGTTNSGNYMIDAVRPIATIVVADAALAIGKTSDVTVTFSEAVSGFSNADLTVANGTLSNVVSSDGGITWEAILTPSLDVTDPTNVLTLDNTGVINASGNLGIGTTDSNNYSIDTLRPTAIIVVSPATLQDGDTAQVTITFSEAVNGFAISDLSVANGMLSSLSSSDGGITWTSTFTPAAGIVFDNNQISLSLTGVRDFSGNVGDGTAVSNSFSLNVPTIVPAPGALSAVAGMPFSQTFTGAGGLGGYGFTLVSSTLPAELTFSGGVLSGTPLSQGVSTLSIIMTAAGGYTSPLYTYTLTVAPSSLAITPPVLPEPMKGVAYNHTLSATGGVAPYNYSLTSGELPGGITLAPSGLLSGVPAGEGAYDFTIQVTDSNGQTATRSYTGVMGAVTLTPETLPDGMAGMPYAQALTATGGTAPYSFAVSAGALPQGLVLSADGTLSGTPAQSGTFAFTAQASDALGARGTRGYSLAIGVNAELVRERFDELGQGFVETRMGLLSSGIELPGLADRRNLSGRPGTVSASNSGNTQVLAFATSLAEINAAGGAAEALAGADTEQPFNVWLDTRLTLHARTDETEHWGEFALVSGGADYLFADNVLVGAALYGDWMSDQSDDSLVEGRGFLAGPYVSIGLAQDVTFDASLLYGRSSNDISAQVLGLDYAGQFDTDRLLFKAKLEGTWAADALTIRPNATFVLMNERAGDYLVSAPDGASVAVPGFEKTDYRIGLGATFEYAYLLDHGAELTPQLGISLAGGNGGDSGAGLFSQAYGKLSAGMVLANGAWRVGGKAEIDLSTRGERAVSAKGTFGVAF